MLSLVDPALGVLSKALASKDLSLALTAARDLLNRHERRVQQFDVSTVKALVRELVALALRYTRTDDERRDLALRVQRLAVDLDGEAIAIPALPAPDDQELIFVNEVFS